MRAGSPQYSRLLVHGFPCAIRHNRAICNSQSVRHVSCGHILLGRECSIYGLALQCRKLQSLTRFPCRIVGRGLPFPFFAKVSIIVGLRKRRGDIFRFTLFPVAFHGSLFCVARRLFLWILSENGGLFLWICNFTLTITERCMYYERIIDRYLSEWASKAVRKPVLLHGTRQVGKSTAVRHLGEGFETYVEVNYVRCMRFPRCSPFCIEHPWLWYQNSCKACCKASR